ncbi:hypothetical protein NHX12_001830 [Muraenolepis orangiensis]|uniref:Uncharacterized protein n=1 Tax=Muraenolepis orangiensis TaxID=630683 RepID=A0A9Q0E1G8_9TELE|nr:hypothetical protein NHX12_001830 [Muraenolepis orangiensis]
MSSTESRSRLVSALGGLDRSLSRERKRSSVARLFHSTPPRSSAGGKLGPATCLVRLQGAFPEGSPVPQSLVTNRAL